MEDIGAENVVTTLTSPLEKIASLGDAHASSIRLCRWGGKESSLASVGDEEVVIWTAENGSDSFRPSYKLPYPKSSTSTSRGPATAVAWDNESKYPNEWSA